ncbi:PIN domain-containing protein [Schizophyllum fasciatum]
MQVGYDSDRRQYEAFMHAQASHPHSLFSSPTPPFDNSQQSQPPFGGLTSSLPQNNFGNNNAGFSSTFNGGFASASNPFTSSSHHAFTSPSPPNAFTTPSPLPPFSPTPDAFASPSNAFHSASNTFRSSASSFSPFAAPAGFASSSSGFATSPSGLATTPSGFANSPSGFATTPSGFAPSTGGSPSTPAPVPPREPSPEPDVPPLPDKAFKHHRQTITQIENDVEMQITALLAHIPSQPPVSEQDDLYLVLDTNILLHFFDVLVRFVDDVERHGVPLVVVVPGIVVRELDSQKNRQDLSWGSRRASTWLLKKIHDKRSAVRGQALGDTMRSSRNWTVREDNERDNNNDYDILDCWRYFASTGKRSVLLSNDNNLRLAVTVECQSGNVRGEAMQPRAHGWSSREMAEMLYGKEYRYLFKDFGEDSKRYTKKKNVKAQIAQPDEDAMDTDEPMKEPDEWILPKHALDILHLNVVNHFEYLLQMLVERVAGPNHSIGRDSGSRYQPEWEKKPLAQWLAPECIQYLQRQRRTAFPGGAADERRLCRFLSREHTRGAGGRRGAMWSRADWDQNLALLERLAQTWADEAIEESLVILYPEWVYIFSLRMTPTGS